MIITGNVQVDGKHLTLGRDMIIPTPQPPKIEETDGKGKKKEVVYDTDVVIDEYEEAVKHFQRLAATMKDDFAGKKMNVDAQLATDINTGALKGTTVEEMERKRSKVIMQLNHSGRQSPFLVGGRISFGKPIGPSAIGVGRGKGARKQGWLAGLVNRIMFQTPKEMTMMDVEMVVEQFVRGAKVAIETGFDGVQLHASHGYLLAQFMSPKSNTRTDDYSAMPGNSLRLLHRIVTSVRAIAPPHFILGVKISSADYVEAGSGLASDEKDDIMSMEEERAVGHVKEIARWKMVDFIEISGGDYEAPEFMLTSRQAFFSRFSRLARSAVQSLPTPRPLIVITGGLRSLEALSDVLDSQYADLAGIGRGSVLTPDLPNRLSEHLTFNRLIASSPSLVDKELSSIFPVQPVFTPSTPTNANPILLFITKLLTYLGILPFPQLIGAGMGMAWYTVQMSRLTRQKGIDYKLGAWGAVAEMWGLSVGLEDGWMLGLGVGLLIGVVGVVLLDWYFWGPRKAAYLAAKAAANATLGYQ